MIVLLNMIVSERNDDLSLMDDDGNKGPFLHGEILQGNTDIGIAFAGDELNSLSLAADQAVKPLDLGAVAVLTGTHITEDGG